MSANSTIAQTINWDKFDRLKADGRSFRAIVRVMDLPYSGLYRAVKTCNEARANGTDPRVSANIPTTLQRIEIVGAPVSSPDAADLKAQIDVLATHVKDLQAHRLEVNAWIATLQAQSRDMAQTRAEPAHIWDDPDDAKSVPFNLSRPHGLKRLLDTEAKRTELPASRPVQHLLMAALTYEKGRHDA